MKKILIGLVLLLSSYAHAASFDINGGACTLNFSPRGGARDVIVSNIDSAKKSIYVMSYSFTSDEIAAALIKAVKRGVKVEMVVDGKQLASRGSDVRLVDDGGVNVYMDSMHAIHHNKVMVFDERKFLTGSFNFSANAESSNAENLLVCPSITASQMYIVDFNKHKAHGVELNDKNFPRE